MLKIYLRTITYEIHNEGQIEYLDSNSHYVIRDEGAVAPKTLEWDAYSDEAQEVYTGGISIWQRKKGKFIVYIGWGDEIYLKQWRYPDAKLVKRITYKEHDCSMKELMKLPTSDVIAYLKQEGLNLAFPS